MKSVVSDIDELDEYAEAEPPRRNRLPLIIGVIAAIAILAIVAMRVSAGLKPQDMTQYKVAPASVDTVEKTVSATGTLQPWTTVDIKSKAGGAINKLYVDVGSIVKKGQRIADIDPTDTLQTVDTARASVNGAIAHTKQAEVTYELQVRQSQIAVASARAALAAAVANVASSRANYASAASQAHAQPALTQTAIEQAQANLDQAIQARDQLNSTDPQQLASAQATYDQALANQQEAKVTLDRQIDLAKQGFVAQQTVDTDQASYDVYAAQANSAHVTLSTIKAQLAANDANAQAKIVQNRAALDNAKAQAVDIPTKIAAAHQAFAQLQQAIAQVASAKAALNQAIANFANNTIQRYNVDYNKTQIALNQANLTDADTTLVQTKVTAPSDGVVLVRDVSQGTIITSGESLSSAGTTIVTIGDLSRMYVEATVDESDIANVSVGQDVNVTFNAYPNTPFYGKVILIQPQAVINQNVTQFNVNIEIDNSAVTFKLLNPGMTATCQFIVQKKDGVLCVPNEAVQTDDSGNSTVEVVTGGKVAPPDPILMLPSDPNTLVHVKIHTRQVQVGLQGDDTTEITSGLAEGEKVVTQTIQPTATTGAPAPSSPFGGGGGPRR